MSSKHSFTSKILSTNLFDGLSSFDEAEARISALPSNKERGDAFEIFAEAYLATQKIAQAQQVWPFEAVPLEQRQLLSLDTGRDMGVDGTYLTIDGELRAYQVKFRSNRTALTWDELSTFMGLTDQVSQRVLFTNSETLPSLMQDRSGFVAIRGSDLDRLTIDDFEAMREWLHSGKVSLPRKQPMPHQQEALTAIAQGLESNDRATVVMACGTGKSLVALWAAEQQNCKNILVLVPSLALVRQLLHEWLRETALEQFTFMCVCSDPSVAMGADDLIVNQADLDFPVTTDSAIVSKFLSKPFHGVKLVFSTYQSAQVVAAGLPLDAHGIAQPFDLAIFDEAHKTASRDGTRFSFALEDANLPIRKRLFFTATPRHYDIRKKDKEGDNALVYSMDKPEIYGQVVHKLSFAEAARRGIICDYKVVISVVTSDMLNDHALMHGEVIVDGDTVKARQVALQIALQKAVEKYGVSRIFTFHGSVAAARSFTSSDGEGIKSHLPDFTTLHVSGEMRTSLREDHMKAFRQADKAVMSNARCLTEGVDVPAVDMVAFISPRKSKVDIVQATGRAMRKSDATGKKFGYVMVPLFVEQTANESIEEALHRTGFDDVWDLLGAMREQDEVLTDIIREMRQEKGRTGGYDESRFSERVEMVGPSVSLDTIRQSITTECLESLSSTWDERFGELLAFTAREGHCIVPKNYQTTDGANLGLWTSNQRATQNSMSAERKEQLESLTSWVWNIIDEQWEIGFRHLKEFSDREENCQVPGKYLTRDGYRLGQWVAAQRNTKDSFLSTERKARLEAVAGWVWDAIAEKWEIGFRHLKEYSDREGNCQVSGKYLTSDGYRLGQWITVQRTIKDSLSAERKERLETLNGWVWDSLDAKWEASFDELKTYKAEHGNVDVPIKWPSGLGSWASVQRRSEKKGKLSPERKVRLDEIGFEWNKVDSLWEERYNELLAYNAEQGNVNIPQKHPSGLGSWLSQQKLYANSGELPANRFEKLSNISNIFVNKKPKTDWDERFNELVVYKAEHGNLDVPRSWPTGLGTWVGNQKSFIRNDKLPLDRKDKLYELGLVWESLDSRWESRLDELLEYRAKYGDVNVPNNWSTGLGQWVANQKSFVKAGRMPENRKKILKDIGLIWSIDGNSDMLTN